ncbi:MAG TPA: hypothetical protein VK787_09250 [Puia sp.]|jgi:hypothetical protein|nr:hypothetical protein [Puia sp.]
MYPAKPGLIIGFHGCDKKVRDEIINSQSMLRYSKNDYDWLGNGMYFWENNAHRAMQFATDQKKNPRKGREPIKNPAVLGAILDLGFCLDLIEKEFIELAKDSYNLLAYSFKLLNIPLPENTSIKDSKELLIRKLDCAVIENVHRYRAQKNLRQFDSVRGVFIEGERIYHDSGFFDKSHMQICVRNPNCVKGFFIPRAENKKWIVP